jgi:hypothetical protein
MSSILDENWAPETTDIANLLGMTMKEKCSIESFWKGQQIIHIKENDLYIEGYYAPQTLNSYLENGVWLESMIGEKAQGYSFLCGILNDWKVYHKIINHNHGLQGYGWCYSDFINLINTNRDPNEDCLTKSLELFTHKNWNWLDEYGIREQKYVTYQERRRFKAEDIVDYSGLCNWCKEENFRLGMLIQGNGQTPNKYQNINCDFADISWGYSWAPIWGPPDIIGIPDDPLILDNANIKHLCIAAGRFEMRVPPLVFRNCKFEEITICGRLDNIVNKLSWLFKGIPQCKDMTPEEYVGWGLKIWTKEITKNLEALGNPKVQVHLQSAILHQPVLYILTKKDDEYILKPL